MAEVYRPVYTAIDATTDKRVRKKSRTWHIRYYLPDGQRPRVKGFKDRKATEALATELERRGARLAAGLENPTDIHGKRPLHEHLTDYLKYITDKGNTKKHVSLTETRIRACLDCCRFVRIADIQPAGVVSFLTSASRRQTEKGEKLPARASLLRITT